MFAYRDSTAMITGASKGLGAAFAKELAGRGMNLVLAARSIDTLQDLADSLGRNGCFRGRMTVSRWQVRVPRGKGGTTLCPTIKSNFLTVKGKENCS